MAIVLAAPIRRTSADMVPQEGRDIPGPFVESSGFLGAPSHLEGLLQLRLTQDEGNAHYAQMTPPD